MQLIKCLSFCIFLFCSSSQLLALDIEWNTARFQVVDNDEDLLEIYLHVVGSTASFVAVEGDSILQAKVAFTLLLSDDKNLLKYEKFELESPLVHKDQQSIDFITLKRFPLPKGKFKLELIAEDLNSKKSTHLNQNIINEFVNKELSMSDIELVGDFQKSEQILNPFYKSGYILIPHIINFYRHYEESLYFYLETYNTDINIADSHLIYYGLTDNQQNILFESRKKQHAQQISALILGVPIAKIPSGNYTLTVEIRDRNDMTLVSKKLPIIRSNPYLEIQTVNYNNVKIQESFVEKLSDQEIQFALKAVLPRQRNASSNTLTNIINSKDQLTKRQYLLSYWATQRANNPKAAYYNYMDTIAILEKEFATSLMHGFESDRGIIYLKYGAPNNIIKENNDLNAPPYEIWEYNDFKGAQGIVKFLFYDEGYGSNQFILLHSTARGEINNPRWKQILYNKTQRDSNNPNDVINIIGGSRASDLFDE